MTETLVLGGNHAPAPEPARTAAPEPASSAKTMLSRLREDVASMRRRDDIYLDIPKLKAKGYCVRFDPNIKFGDLEQWKGWATTRAPNGTEVFDNLLVACWVIVKCCRGILIDKTEIADSHGQPVTFESQDLWAELSVMSSTAAVERFYGDDFHIISTSNAITNMSGFGDTVGVASPLGP